jgi:hypothetical protein
MMVALFQIPKCERCELAPEGPKGPVYWAVVNHESLEVDGFAYSAMFKNRGHALIWCRHCSEKRGLQAARCVRVSPSAPMTIRWEDSSHESLPGDQITADVRIYKNLAQAERYLGKGNPALVVVKS